MSNTNPALRRDVIRIYKGTFFHAQGTTNIVDAFVCSHTNFASLTELLNLCKAYPLGYEYAQSRLHKAFSANVGLTNEEEIKKGIERAEFVRKEIEAL